MLTIVLTHSKPSTILPSKKREKDGMRSKGPSPPEATKKRDPFHEGTTRQPSRHLPHQCRR